MRAALLSFAKRRTQFVGYCLIGLTGASLDYTSFFVMVNWLGVHYLVANAVSTSLGIINNFFLNTLFTFKVRNRLLARLVSFYCVGLAGLTLSSLILFICISRQNLNPNASKAATIIIVVLLQYNLNRLISFKQ